MKKQNDIYSMDGYAHRSPLRQWNPKFKVLTVVLILFLCILADNLAVSLFAVISMGAVNIGMNRISARNYGVLLAVPLAFIVMGSAAIAIEAGLGENGWYLRVPAENLKQSLEVVARAFGSISILYFLTLSTPVSELISVLQHLHVPKVMIELMYLIYRYIFILMDTQCRIKDAAESRLGYVDFKTACYTFGISMGSLLVLSLKKANLYYDAMVSRCYDGELLFLEEEKPLTAVPVISAVLYIAGMAAAFMI